MSTTSLLKLTGDLQNQLGNDLRTAWSKRTLLHKSYLSCDDAEAISDRIMDIVALPGIRSECIRLAHRGGAVPTLDYVKVGQIGAWTIPDLIDHKRLHSIITKRRATLLVDSLNLYDRDFATLQVALSNHFDSIVDLSAILTPRWSKGLSIHIDSEDVVVIQLKGTKDWNVHQPVNFSFHHGRGIEQTDLTRRERSVRLRPGDLMYVPRGAPHVAASGEEGSVHLALAIERPTVSSLIKRSQHDHPIPGKAGYGHVCHEQLLKNARFFTSEVSLNSTNAIEKNLHPAMVARSLRSLTGPLDEKAQFEAVDGFILSDSDYGSIVATVGSTQVRVPVECAAPLRILATGNRVCASSVSDTDSVYLDQLIRLGLVNVVTSTQ